MKKIIIILLIITLKSFAGDDFYVGKDINFLKSISNDTNIEYVRFTEKTFIYRRKDVDIIYKFEINSDSICTRQITIVSLRYYSSIKLMLEQNYTFIKNNLYINKNNKNYLKINKTNLMGYVTLEVY